MSLKDIGYSVAGFLFVPILFGLAIIVALEQEIRGTNYINDGEKGDML